MADEPQEKLPLSEQQGQEQTEGTGEPLTEFNSPCPPDPIPGHDPNRLYQLRGPQVDPEAGYWSQGPHPLPQVVPIGDVLSLTTNSASPYYVPPYPRDPAFLDWEIQELAYLQAHRDDPAAISGDFSTTPPAHSLPADFVNTTRQPISDFIQLDPPPFGAIFNIGTRPQYRIENINQQHLRRQPSAYVTLPPVVTTGRQLARMFENETPGLVHRNALNYLLYKQGKLSPPRQARVWMALDVAIYSALVAAWYYKWAFSQDGIDPLTYSYRQRPFEYDQNTHFRVLFDDVVGDLGVGNKCPRPTPCPSPGTPRHPAYPSGHSTFSAAASKLLAYFFPDEEEQLLMLANNIGTARLWAGVHWRTDHAAGQRIGFAVAQRVIEQLENDCVPRYDDRDYSQPDNPVPDYDTVRQRARDRRSSNPCPERDTQDRLPDQKRDPFDDCNAPSSVF